MPRFIRPTILRLAFGVLSLGATSLEAQVVTQEISPEQHRRMCAAAQEFLQTGRRTWVQDSTYAFMLFRVCGREGYDTYVASWWAVRGSTDTKKLREMVSYSSTVLDTPLRDTLEAIVRHAEASEPARLAALRALMRGREYGTSTGYDSLDGTPIDARCDQYHFTDVSDAALPPQLVERADAFLAEVLDSELPYRVRRLSFCWLDIHRGFVYVDSAQALIAQAIRRSLVGGDVWRLERVYDKSRFVRDARVADAALFVAGSRIANPTVRLFALRTLWWAAHGGGLKVSTEWLLGRSSDPAYGACPAAGELGVMTQSADFQLTPLHPERIRVVAARLAADATMDRGVRSFAKCLTAP